MEQNKNGQTMLKPEKAYTFFLVPFYFEEGEWDAVYSRLGRWKPTKEEFYNSDDVLYPYIINLFKQTTPSSGNHFKIYELQTEDKGINSQMFTDRLLGKNHMAILAKNSKEKVNPKIITFTLLDKGCFAPLLFVSSTANIGIFTFAIEITGDKSVDWQIDLNYALHKRNETDNYQCICINPDKKNGIHAITDYIELMKQFPNLWKDNQKNTRTNTDYICWNLNDFVDCIMGTMGKPNEDQKRIKYFSQQRMHLFSFCSIQDIDNNITEEDILPDLLCMSRCVDAKYMLPFNQMEKQGSVLQTYENIFFASSNEGTAMMAIGRASNRAFVDNLHQKFNRQYLLIYLLVLIQRYTMQSIERKITEFESTGKQTDDKLWNLINVICRIKTYCYYTDVSIYTHHSQFYQLCSRNLNIQETFKEVGEKIDLLKLTTDRNIQKALNEQEERRKKDMDRLTNENKKTEQRQNMLNIIVAILTIAQVMQASYELISQNHRGTALCWSIGIGVLCAGILVRLMWKDIVLFFKSRKNK